MDSGALIGGTIMWQMLYIPLEQKRLGQYSVIHEIGLSGFIPIFITLLGTILIIAGIFLMIKALKDSII